jgi:adenylate kinase
LRISIILLGPPGAGKGTQARLLCETFNIAHIATGDILRNAIKNDTEVGRQAKALIEAGLLVPNELVDAIVRERLRQPDCDRGFIFDGYPRTLAQADTLRDFLEQDDILSLAIGINVSDEVLIARLGVRWTCPVCNRTFSEALSFCEIKGFLCAHCGVSLIHREDDTVEVITERLKIYHEQTEPLIRYYQERGTYIPVDGDRLPEKIFNNISSAVKERVSAASIEEKKGSA